jgi:putative membrane protein
MMWPLYGWGFGGFWWIMPILMIVFWGLIIWGIVMLVRRPSSSSSGPNDDSALEILKKRYAAGEITREEFGEKRKAIM